VDLVLTSASRINKYTQGKANLFVVSGVYSGGLSIRSHTFVGAFPLWQLVDVSHMSYRNLDVTPDTPIVAGRALWDDAIQFTSIRKLRLSDQERKLRATDILGIPVSDRRNAAAVGDYAAITVDFALPFTHRWLFRWLVRRAVLRRAAELQIVARHFLSS
jgi:hypothetical protein